MVIIVESKDPKRLWEKICNAVSENRFESWEQLPDGRLAFFKWPTRHVALLLVAIVDPARHRLTLLDHGRDPASSDDALALIQGEMAARLQCLFGGFIEATRVESDAASPW